MSSPHFRVVAPVPWSLFALIAGHLLLLAAASSSLGIRGAQAHPDPDVDVSAGPDDAFNDDQIAGESLSTFTSSRAGKNLLNFSWSKILAPRKAASSKSPSSSPRIGPSSTNALPNLGLTGPGVKALLGPPISVSPKHSRPPKGAPKSQARPNDPGAAFTSGHPLLAPLPPKAIPRPLRQDQPNASHRESGWGPKGPRRGPKGKRPKRRPLPAQDGQIWANPGAALGLSKAPPPLQPGSELSAQDLRGYGAGPPLRGPNTINQVPITPPGSPDVPFTQQPSTLTANLDLLNAPFKSSPEIKVVSNWATDLASSYDGSPQGPAMNRLPESSARSPLNSGPSPAGSEISTPASPPSQDLRIQLTSPESLPQVLQKNDNTFSDTVANEYPDNAGSFEPAQGIRAEVNNGSPDRFSSPPKDKGTVSKTSPTGTWQGIEQPRPQPTFGATSATTLNDFSPKGDFKKNSRGQGSSTTRRPSQSGPSTPSFEGGDVGGLKFPFPVFNTPDLIMMGNIESFFNEEFFKKIDPKEDKVKVGQSTSSPFDSGPSSGRSSSGSGSGVRNPGGSQGSEALKTPRPFSNTYNLSHGEIAKGGHLFDIDLSQNPSLLTEDPEGLPVGHLAGDSTSEAFFSSKSSDGEGQINRVNNKKQFFRGSYRKPVVARRQLELGELEQDVSGKNHHQHGMVKPHRFRGTETVDSLSDNPGYLMSFAKMDIQKMSSGMSGKEKDLDSSLEGSLESLQARTLPFTSSSSMEDIIDDNTRKSSAEGRQLGVEKMWAPQPPAQVSQRRMQTDSRLPPHLGRRQMLPVNQWVTSGLGQLGGSGFFSTPPIPIDFPKPPNPGMASVPSRTRTGWIQPSRTEGDLQTQWGRKGNFGYSTPIKVNDVTNFQPVMLTTPSSISVENRPEKVVSWTNKKGFGPQRGTTISAPIMPLNPSSEHDTTSESSLPFLGHDSDYSEYEDEANKRKKGKKTPVQIPVEDTERYSGPTDSGDGDAAPEYEYYYEYVYEDDLDDLLSLPPGVKATLIGPVGPPDTNDTGLEFPLLPTQGDTLDPSDEPDATRSRSTPPSSSEFPPNVRSGLENPRSELEDQNSGQILQASKGPNSHEVRQRWRQSGNVLTSPIVGNPIRRQDFGQYLNGTRAASTAVPTALTTGTTTPWATTSTTMIKRTATTTITTTTTTTTATSTTELTSTTVMSKHLMEDCEDYLCDTEEPNYPLKTVINMVVSEGPTVQGIYQQVIREFPELIGGAGLMWESKKKKVGSCETEEVVKKPGWAKTIEGHWLVVVNTNEYPQEIRTIRCRSSGDACSMGNSRFNAICQQAYTERRLMVVDPKQPEKGVFTDFFNIPSSCSCAQESSDVSKEFESVMATKEIPRSADQFSKEETDHMEPRIGHVIHSTRSSLPHRSLQKSAPDTNAEHSTFHIEQMADPLPTEFELKKDPSTFSSDLEESPSHGRGRRPEMNSQPAKNTVSSHAGDSKNPEESITSTPYETHRRLTPFLNKPRALAEEKQRAEEKEASVLGLNPTLSPKFKIQEEFRHEWLQEGKKKGVRDEPNDGPNAADSNSSGQIDWYNFSKTTTAPPLVTKAPIVSPKHDPSNFSAIMTTPELSLTSLFDLDNRKEMKRHFGPLHGHTTTQSLPDSQTASPERPSATGITGVKITKPKPRLRTTPRPKVAERRNSNEDDGEMDRNEAKTIDDYKDDGAIVEVNRVRVLPNNDDVPMLVRKDQAASLPSTVATSTTSVSPLKKAAIHRMMDRYKSQLVKDEAGPTLITPASSSSVFGKTTTVSTTATSQLEHGLVNVDKNLPGPDDSPILGEGAEEGREFELDTENQIHVRKQTTNPSGTPRPAAASDLFKRLRKRLQSPDIKRHENVTENRGSELAPPNLGPASNVTPLKTSETSSPTFEPITTSKDLSVGSTKPAFLGFQPTRPSLTEIDPSKNRKGQPDPRDVTMSTSTVPLTTRSHFYTSKLFPTTSENLVPSASKIDASLQHQSSRIPTTSIPKEQSIAPTTEASSAQSLKEFLKNGNHGNDPKKIQEMIQRYHASHPKDDSSRGEAGSEPQDSEGSADKAKSIFAKYAKKSKEHPKSYEEAPEEEHHAKVQETIMEPENEDEDYTDVDDSLSAYKSGEADLGSESKGKDLSSSSSLFQKFSRTGLGNMKNLKLPQPAKRPPPPPAPSVAPTKASVKTSSQKVEEDLDKHRRDSPMRKNAESINRLSDSSGDHPHLPMRTNFELPSKGRPPQVKGAENSDSHPDKVEGSKLGGKDVPQDFRTLNRFSKYNPPTIRPFRRSTAAPIAESPPPTFELPKNSSPSPVETLEEHAGTPVKDADVLSEQAVPEQILDTSGFILTPDESAYHHPGASSKMDTSWFEDEEDASQSLKDTDSAEAIGNGGQKSSQTLFQRSKLPIRDALDVFQELRFSFGGRPRPSESGDAAD